MTMKSDNNGKAKPAPQRPVGKAFGQVKSSVSGIGGLRPQQPAQTGTGGQQQPTTTQKK